MKDYYGILRVPVSATIDQIKKAYRINAVKYHPDKNQGDNTYNLKFIEIQEAYDVLSDVDKRRGYDEIIRNLRENYANEGRGVDGVSDEFSYNHQSFFSYSERDSNETPQEAPEVDHWGEKLNSDADFFLMPKNIGKILSGYTTLNKESMPHGYIFKIFVILVVFFAMINGFLVFVDVVQVQIIYAVLGFVSVFFLAIYLIIKFFGFKHLCNYVGINGFAEFECEGDRNKNVKSSEINFNSVKDFFSILEVENDVSYNNFIWFEDNNKIVYEHKESYYRDVLPGRNRAKYWMNVFAEKYWTIFLLDRMEEFLEKRGSIDFSIYNREGGRTPFIYLGIGFIKVFSPNGWVNYNFDEIKRTYISKGYLVIEHKNYERKFIFFDVGDKAIIPLFNLSNRMFFFRAMEILMGCKIV